MAHTLLWWRHQEREATIEAAHRERVEARATATLTAKMPVFGAIAANRVKALRTLAAARKKVDDLHKATRKTLVQQYADYGSPGEWLLGVWGDWRGVGVGGVGWMLASRKSVAGGACTVCYVVAVLRAVWQRHAGVALSTLTVLQPAGICNT